MKHIYIIIFLFSALNLFSQSFTTVSTSLPDCSQGGLSWGDFDNDGDLDIAMSGVLEAGTEVMIFKNKNGEFTKVTTSIPGLTLGTVNWGDYDNDNDLDLLVCGTNSIGDGVTKLYRNDNGVFNDAGIPFTGIASGKAIWLDYNNDQKLDVLIMGDTLYVTPVTKLYRNNGNGTFTHVPQNIPGILECFATPGDYDNDGDQDLLVSGVYDSVYGTHLYRNDNGIYIESSIPLFSVAYGSGLFFDYDNDGHLDIIYMGATMEADYKVKIYHNEGASGFVESTDSLEGEWVGRIDAADIDNDGFTDIAITGALCCGNALSRIYMNDHNGHFTLSSVYLPDLYFSQVNFGDYDNDGDADFILFGIPPDGPGNTYTRLYRNNAGTNIYTAQQHPSVPAGLTVDVTENDAEISWQPSTDNNTPAEGLTYSLRVGYAPGGSEVLSSFSDAVTGFRKIYGHGNVCQNTSWKINNLAEGDYYCAVQALDHGCMTSAFSPEISFHIGPTGSIEKENSLIISPNPASDFISIKGCKGNAEIFDMTGRKVLSVCEVEYINISALNSGIYNILISDKGRIFSSKFIKK